MRGALQNPLLVAAHDAGGAHVIASWLKRNWQGSFACVAEGPAKSVFQTGFPGIVLALKGEDAFDRLNEFRTLLTGTSWGADLERKFLKRGNEVGIKTVAYLDHWTDYRERFVLDGIVCMPREVWVCDRYAESLAKVSFPESVVLNVGNSYLDEVVEQIKAETLPRTSGAKDKRILFVSEPIRAAAERKFGDSRYYGYTEYDALGQFLDYALENWLPTIEVIRIRRHPSEPVGKFGQFIGTKAGVRIEESTTQAFASDCAWADYIVGCQSMAMVIGLMAGKRVFSAIPENGKPMEIPFPGITPLFQSI